MRERKRDKSLSHSDCAVEYLSESGAAVLHTHTDTLTDTGEARPDAAVATWL